MILELDVLDTKNILITTHRDTKIMTIEASDMKGIQVRRVFDDAYDVGFKLKSHKTGKEVIFTKGRQEISDGDLLWTEFHPYRCEELRGWTLRVFND